MPKIYVHVAGNTLGSHEKLVKKLRKRGAKKAKSPEKCDYIVLFCPIVSRFETDINSALSEISGTRQNVIVVAMHHTFDPNYTLPNSRQMSNPAVLLMVDCLFHEKNGFYRCSRNRKAKKTIYKEMELRKLSCVGRA